METTVIHIGYHKSASTFLQQQVFPNLPVNYVFFAGEKRQYLDMLESAKGLDVDGVRNWVENEISRKYPLTRHAVTVLSHEELSGHPHGYKSISPFIIASNLKACFPNAKILIIIRNQLDYLTSLYSFRVAIKGRETRSFSQFLEEEGNKGLFEHLEYDRLIEHHQELFGKENVAILPVELLKSNHDEFFANLFSFLGIPAQQITNVEPSNVSTRSVILIDFWRLNNGVFNWVLGLSEVLFGKRPDNYQGLRSTYYNVKRNMTSRLNKWVANSQQLGINKLPFFNDLIRRFADSNTHLQGMVGFDLSEYKYP
jgi:hypothetical protein